MRTSTSILLLALFAGAIAAQGTIRNRLAQNNAKNLAQSWDSNWVDCGEDIAQPPELNLTTLECPCNFSALPGLGGGLSQSFQQRAEATQVSEVAAVPDTEFQQICQTNCCECAQAAHAALAVQAKNRTFTISGAISVLERVFLAERERAAEQAISEAEKNTVCVTNNANGGQGSEAECIELTVCPPNATQSVSSLGGSKVHPRS